MAQTFSGTIAIDQGGAEEFLPIAPTGYVHGAFSFSEPASVSVVSVGVLDETDYLNGVPVDGQEYDDFEAGSGFSPISETGQFIYRVPGGFTESYFDPPFGLTEAVFTPVILGAYFEIEGAQAGDLHYQLTFGVPEPATWSLLVGGFGFIGGALRLKGRSVRTAL